jgi:lysine/ornithine N-monooxygenase
MIELQLKKQRVDQQDNKDLSSDEVIEGSGYVVGDRNKLLDQLIQKVNETDDKSNKEDK